MFSKGQKYWYMRRECIFVEQKGNEYHFDIVGGAHLIINCGKEYLIRDGY